MSKTATYKIEGYIGPFEPDFMKPGDKFVTSDMLRDWIEENKAASKFIIEIDSNGGSTTHGFKMYDLLKTSGKEIETVGWNVKSIATAPFLAGMTRKMAEHGEFLIHNPWINPQNLGWSLTADEAFSIAEDIKAEENKLFDFYADKINAKGKDAKILRAFMSKNINMPIADVVEWGFATEIIGQTANVFKSAPVFAYADTMNLKQYKKETMGKDKTAAKSAWDTLMGAFNKFKAEVVVEKKSATVTLEDGATILYLSGDLAEGSSVFLDEAMENLATETTYILDNGTTITLENGVITAIAEVSAGEELISALKLRNSTLIAEHKAAIEALQTENTTLKEANANIQAQVQTMATSLAEFESKHFSTDGVKPKKVEAQAFAKDKPEGPSRFARLRKKLN